MRLSRFLARAGVTSRRAAESLIAAGRVSVNGAVVTELSTRVEPRKDVVEVDGRRAELPGSYTYLALNKPSGFVVTMADPQRRPTVADLVSDVSAGVVPIGRLDAATEGLLLLTNDGDLAFRISHPSYELEKEYEVTARGILTEDERRALEVGIDLDGRATAPAKVSIRSAKRNTTVALMTIHEGRKRQIRRMFEAVGHPVRNLRRTRVGPVRLGDLRPARWRHLGDDELRALREAVGLPAE